MLSTSVDDEVIEVQSQAYDQGAKLERHEEGDEEGGAEDRGPARIPLKMFSEDHQTTRILWKVEVFFQTYSELFS